MLDSSEFIVIDCVRDHNAQIEAAIIATLAIRDDTEAKRIIDAAVCSPQTVRMEVVGRMCQPIESTGPS